MSKRDADDIARDIYYLTLIATASFTGSNMVEPMLPLRIVELGASSLDLGIIVGLASVAAFMSRLPAGMLFLRKRLRALISVALVGEAVSYVMYGLSPSYQWLCPFRLLWGISGALFMVGTIATVSNLSAKERIGWAMGTYLTSYGLATVLGPLFCSVLLYALSCAQVLMSAAVLPVLALVLLNLRFGPGSVGDTYAGISSNRAQEVQASTNSMRGAFDSLVSIVRRRRVAVAGTLHFLFSVSITFLDTIFVVYAVTQLGISPSVAALMLAARGVANSLSRMPAGNLMDRVGSKIPFLGSFAVLTLCYLVIAYATDIPTLSVAMLLLGASWGVRVVLEWTATQDEIPPESRPIASAFLPLVWDVAHATGAFAVGILAMLVPPAMVFVAASGLMIVAIAVVLLFLPDGDGR